MDSISSSSGTYRSGALAPRFGVSCGVVDDELEMDMPEVAPVPASGDARRFGFEVLVQALSLEAVGAARCECSRSDRLSPTAKAY